LFAAVSGSEKQSGVEWFQWRGGSGMECYQRGFDLRAQVSQAGVFSSTSLFKKSVILQLQWQSQYNKSLLPSPLTLLACARRVKGSLATLGAAELNR